MEDTDTKYLLRNLPQYTNYKSFIENWQKDFKKWSNKYDEFNEVDFLLELKYRLKNHSHKLINNMGMLKITLKTRKREKINLGTICYILNKRFYNCPTVKEKKDFEDINAEKLSKYNIFDEFSNKRNSPYGKDEYIISKGFFNSYIKDFCKVCFKDKEVALIFDTVKFSNYKKATEKIISYINNYTETKQIPISQPQQEQTKETQNIDLSDTKLTEQIIMLEKLGVLEFLKNKEPFNTSTNALASVLSGITGKNIKTIQSYINPIFSKGVEQKNNPLKKAKTVDKVIQKLNSIGYKQS